MPKNQPNLPLNLGLYMGRSPLMVPARAVADGRNFRIRQGFINNVNMGWLPFSPTLGTNRSTTKVYLPFDGLDGTTVIREGAAGQAAPYPNWTVAGNAQLDTAQFKFGGSSLLLDGTGDWVTRPDGSDITLGSNNFRINAQVRPNANGTEIRIAGQTDNPITAAASAWYLYRDSANHIVFQLSNGSSFISLTSTSTVLTGAMKEVTITRMGNDIRMMVQGVFEAGNVFSGAVNDSAQNLFVGAIHAADGAPWNGWIDEFYMDIGASDYPTATFSPATSPLHRVLNGAVTLIETFAPRGFAETLVVATIRDLYSFDSQLGVWTLRTPTYNTATVNVSNATPAVVTANTGAPNWVTTGIKAGDRIMFQTTAFPHESGDWYTIATVDSNTQLTLTTAVTGAPLTNVSYVIRRVFAGALRDIFDTDTFVRPDDGVNNDLIFVTNGVDPVVTWDGNAAVAIYRPTLGFKARQIRIFKNMMLYGGLIMNSGELRPTSFINSDLGKPLDVVNGLAGEFRAHDGVDPITEMEDLGDNMVIYSERHITPVQFVGDPLVFVFRQASTGIGPIAPRVVADFGDYHEFVGTDSQYLFDGVSVTEVGTQVWREVLRQRDALRQGLAFHHFDEENGDLIWTVPLTSDAGVGVLTAPPEEAFVEHYLEIDDERVPDPHSRREMPFTASGYSITRDILTWDELTDTWANLTLKWNDSFLFSAFPTNLMGGSDGKLYIINISQRANGAILPSFIRLGRQPNGDTKIRGLLSRIYLFATQFPGLLTVNTFYSDHGSGPITTTQTNTFDTMLAPERHFVTPYRRGRFVEFEFRRDDGEAWELEGYEPEIKGGGRR